MPNKERASSSPEQAATTVTQNVDANPLVGETAELVEGQIAEVAPNLNTKATGQGSGQDQKKKKKKDDTQLTERDLLKARLLEQAPKTPVMKSEVKKVLEKERVSLEGDIEKYRRKKQYHHLSAAIMKLRLVMRQIEDLARSSVDQVKEMWLKVVHRFA
jgi:hypothetical protein